MNDLALDIATTDAQLDARSVEPARDPWLARRAYGFGASDVPALLLALGRRGPDAPRYMKENAKLVSARGRSVPRLLAEKAGILAPKKAGSAAAVGSAREVELLGEWRRLLENGQFYCDAESLIDTTSIKHAGDVPREWFPLVDRTCPALTCTPDAWCRDTLGELVGVELKCSRDERRELPWYWRVQKQAQLAVTGETHGLVVCGEGWARGLESIGPIRVWEVARDEDVIAEIRAAAAAAWTVVEQLKAA